MCWYGSLQASLKDVVQGINGGLALARNDYITVAARITPQLLPLVQSVLPLGIHLRILGEHMTQLHSAYLRILLL